MEESTSLGPCVVTFVQFFVAEGNAHTYLCVCALCFVQEDLNAIDMEDDKRDLISREISKFRDTHKVQWLI